MINIFIGKEFNVKCMNRFKHLNALQNTLSDIKHVKVYFNLLNIIITLLMEFNSYEPVLSYHFYRRSRQRTFSIQNYSNHEHALRLILKSGAGILFKQVQTIHEIHTWTSRRLYITCTQRSTINFRWFVRDMSSIYMSHDIV